MCIRIICLCIFLITRCNEICCWFLQKRGKRKWIFRKPLVQETMIQHNEEKNFRTSGDTSVTSGAETLPKNTVPKATDDKQRRAIAVAMATTAAAEAAVATAQAAVEIIRLTGPSILVRTHFAAITIQTAFRGYLVISFPCCGDKDTNLFGCSFQNWFCANTFQELFSKVEALLVFTSYSNV